METRGEPLGSSRSPETAEVRAVTLSEASSGQVRLRLEDGSEQELAVPDHLSRLIRPGLDFVLYHGSDGRLLGWYLPDRGIGLDLRS